MQYVRSPDASAGRRARRAAVLLFAAALGASASIAAEDEVRRLEQERQALQAELRDMPAGEALAVHLRLSMVHHELARELSSRDRPAEAEAALTNALGHEEAIYGADSPLLWPTLELRAERAWETGSLDRVRADYTRLAAIHAADDPSSEKRGFALASLAALEFIAGDPAAAAAAWNEVVDLRAARYGETDPAVATGTRELAVLQTMAQQGDAARRSQARAEALSRTAKATGAAPRGPHERTLLMPLAEGVELRLPAALTAENRSRDCDRARTWLRIARLRAAGPDPETALFDYDQAVQSVPGGSRAPAALALLDEQAALLERLGKRDHARMMRENASNLRRNPQNPAVPACSLE